MKEVNASIKKLEAQTKPLEEALGLLQWDLALTGDPSYQPLLVEKEMEMHAIFSKSADYEYVKKGRKNKNLNPETNRTLEQLYRIFLSHQEPDDLARKKVELAAEISGIFSNFRSCVDDDELTANDIKQILKESTDSNDRRKVWEASKQIGPLVSPLIIERVKICNSIAKELGFRDYYTLQLELQEIEERDLDLLFHKIDFLTRAPFQNLKEKLDLKLTAYFGLAGSDQLRPWHYEDPFFQEAPPLTDLNLDHLYENKNLEELTRLTFNHVGLEIQSILSQSDLYEKQGKDQHAFCLMIGRNPEQVRVLCNCRNNSYWMGTMLHEFGHGVYDSHLNSSQEFFLRDVAHISTTEAIAMLFGRLSHNPAWLEKILGLDAKKMKEITPLVKQETSWQMLVFTRWSLVMYYFEKQLYANPMQDLNTLWWDLVEKYQLIKRPENRNRPDWASKIHIALHPAYYHNYMIGEMTASQIQHTIENELGNLPMILQPKTGHWLKERLFSQGALRPWNETLEFLTGEKLNPGYFANEFFKL